MLKVSERVNKYRAEIGSLKRLGCFFEKDIICHLTQIDQKLAELKDFESFEIFLQREKQYLANLLDWFPLKTKTLKLIDRILYSLPPIKNTIYNENENYFCKLPAEMISAIFSFLNFKQLIRMTKVNLKFCNLLKDASFTFWPRIIPQNNRQLTFQRNVSSPVVDILTYAENIISLHEDGRVHAWNSTSRKYLHGIDRDVTAIAKSNEILWLGKNNGKILAWNVNEAKFVTSMKTINMPVKSIASYTIDKLIMTSTYESEKNHFMPLFHIIDTKSSKINGYKNAECFSNNAYLLCSSKKYIIAAREKNIIIWSSTSLDFVKYWKSQHSRYSIQQVFLYEDLIILRYADNCVSILDIISGDITKLQDYYASLKCINILLSGYIVMGYINGTIRIFDIRKMKFLEDIKTQLPISFITSSSTNQILIGCLNGSIEKLILSEVDYDITNGAVCDGDADKNYLTFNLM